MERRSYIVVVTMLLLQRQATCLWFPHTSSNGDAMDDLVLSLQRPSMAYVRNSMEKVI